VGNRCWNQSARGRSCRSAGVDGGRVVEVEVEGSEMFLGGKASPQRLRLKMRREGGGPRTRHPYSYPVWSPHALSLQEPTQFRGRVRPGIRALGPFGSSALSSLSLEAGDGDQTSPLHPPNPNPLTPASGYPPRFPARDRPVHRDRTGSDAR